MNSFNKNNAANDSILSGKEFEMMINNRKQDISKETIRETKNEEQAKSENDFINSILAGDDDGDGDGDDYGDNDSSNDGESLDGDGESLDGDGDNGAESDIDINQLVKTLQKTIKHTNTNQDLNITKLKQHI